MRLHRLWRRQWHAQSLQPTMTPMQSASCLSAATLGVYRSSHCTSQYTDHVLERLLESY